MKSEFLKEWERATENLVQYFSAKYFGDGADMWWVAEEVGGVLHINDYFFSLGDIVDFLKYNYSQKKIFEYYQYSLDMAGANCTKINIKNFKKIEIKYKRK